MQNTERMKHLLQKQRAAEKQIKNKSFDFRPVQENSHSNINSLKMKDVEERQLPLKSIPKPKGPPPTFMTNARLRESKVSNGSSLQIQDALLTSKKAKKRRRQRSLAGKFAMVGLELSPPQAKEGKQEDIHKVEKDLTFDAPKL